MSIPLNQMYNYIDTINNETYSDCILIYHFWPHGSKKIQDLQGLHARYDLLDYMEKLRHVNMIMHDQEPLKYDQYQGHDIVDYVCNNTPESAGLRPFTWPITETTTAQELEIIEVYKNLNLRFATRNPFSVFDLTLLTHSEKNSDELKTYEQNGFVGVYWWSHAVIARDWFRYFQYIEQKKNVSKTFLIYNRAWSGTREYRLKFAELLIRLGLETHCQTNINPVEPELQIHYELHKFSNPVWRPGLVLENYFPETEANSWASADITLADYESTDIEVVLETLFDDPRQQLTEKALRPIAAGQPFILAATAGSLEYLRSYGFKTYAHIWDERYDQTNDSEERLMRIADLMRSIANWTPEQRINKLAQAKVIADYNKNLFFSAEWQDGIIKEYRNNFASAMKIVTQHITACHTKKLQQLAPDTPERKENRRKIIELANATKEKFTNFIFREQ